MKNRSPIDYEFGHFRLDTADCRLPATLDRNEALCDAFAVLLLGEIGLTRASFYHLRSAGLLADDYPKEARPRCELYDSYLKTNLL
jgi:hypothetical protein